MSPSKIHFNFKQLQKINLFVKQNNHFFVGVVKQIFSCIWYI